MEQLLKDEDGKLTNFIEKIRPVKEEMIKMGFPQVCTNIQLHINIRLKFSQS